MFQRSLTGLFTQRATAGLLLCLAALSLPACGSVSEVCGVRSEHGGPPRLLTRQQQACELTRSRMLSHLNASASDSEIDAYKANVRQWRTSRNLQVLGERIGGDVDPALGAELAAALVKLRDTSTKPYDPPCEDVERCLVEAAVHGADLAIHEAWVPVPIQVGPDGGTLDGDPQNAPVDRSEELEELSD